MNEAISHTSADASEYSIRVLDGTIQLDWYYQGSVQGGTGTEGVISIGREKISDFFEKMEFEGFSDFLEKIRVYDDNKWSNLRKVMREFSNGSWTWSETDWS